MKRLFFITCILFSIQVLSQKIRLDDKRLEPVNVYISAEKMMGSNVVKVVKDSAVKLFDEATYAKIKGVDFKNGTIEVKVLSRLLKDAPEFARGFIGVAFHVNDSNSKFECIYLRPVNARVNDQVRRNHSIQYFSYPGYKFDRLRKEDPERYEAYTDMEMNQWITMRIVVKDTNAKLYINNQEQPSLVVNDLKHGADVSGSIAFWVETGTKGYFKDLKIIKEQ